MDAIREGMEFNGRVWKEPRGFIKILELLFGIIAFATTSSFSQFLTINYQCQSDPKQNHVLTLHFQYPFDLSTTRILLNPCGNSTESVGLGGSYSSSAEFFVAIGVLTFLYCLAALLMYIFLDKLYRSRDNVPTIDFVVTVLFAFFWLVCSSAWAHGISGVKDFTNPQHVVDRLAISTPGKPAFTAAQPGNWPNYANLNISVLLGFLNCFIWAGNVWFLWKETSWYRARYPATDVPPLGNTGPMSGMGPQTGAPKI